MKAAWGCSRFEQDPETGAPPPAKIYSCHARIGDKLYFFGGQSNELWIYSVEQNLWWLQATNNLRNEPPPRTGCGMVTDGQSLYMFAGNDLSGLPLGDIWRYDPPQKAWTDLSPPLAKANPPKRHRPGMAYFKGADWAGLVSGLFMVKCRGVVK